MKKIYNLLFFLAFSGAIQAQEEGKVAPTVVTPAVEKSNVFKLYSVGLGFGYYKPGFNYWNDRTPYSFSGGVLPSLQLDVDLIANVRARLSGGYYNSIAKLTRIPTWGEERVTQTLTPLSLSAYYYLPGSIVTLYGGGGADLMLVKSVYQSPEPNSKQTGNGTTTTGHFLLGLETAVDRLIIGLETRYYVGNYTQTLQVSRELEPFKEDIQINGWYVGLNFKYALAPSDNLNGR
jgi:hypothetical protein